MRPARPIQRREADEKHGDAKLLYLIGTLTNCPKTQSANIYDQCKARYEGLSTR
jgi:hypothetical protein